MKRITLAVLSGLILAGAAHAAGPINLRQADQERRIDAGVRSGKLTAAEAARLRAQQDGIKAYAQQLKDAHGGKLTKRDEALIHSRQDAANAAILKRKDNAARGPNHLKL